MIEVRKTTAFAAWLANAPDRDAKGRIVSRITRLEQGQPWGREARWWRRQ